MSVYSGSTEPLAEGSDDCFLGSGMYNGTDTYSSWSNYQAGPWPVVGKPKWEPLKLFSSVVSDFYVLYNICLSEKCKDIFSFIFF